MSKQTISTLSKKYIPWDEFDIHLAGLISRSSRSTETISRDRIEQVFQDAGHSFEVALRRVRKMKMISISLVIISVSLSILGGVIISIFDKQMFGLMVAGGGASALIAVLRRIFILARDELMLELILPKYKLALQLSSSEQYQNIISAFLEETTSWRPT